MNLLSPNRTIYYQSLIPTFESKVADALLQLRDQLETHYPSVPYFDVEPLEAEEDPLFSHLHRRMPGVYSNEQDENESLQHKRIFLLCGVDEPFVQHAQQENHRAHWGIAVPMTFSIAWVDNPFLWWHEALHLFNAKDCYNKFGINKCQEPNCIMQASPTQQACGRRLHLCSKNQKRISLDPLF